MNARIRFQRLATAILLVVAAYAAIVFELLSESSHVSVPVRWLVTLLSSSGVYALLVRGFIVAITRSDRLLALYWGSDLYFRGLWHYTSVYHDEIYLGIWRIDQDALGIRIRAFGVNANYQRRFTAFSVTDLMEYGGSPGVYEIVNARNDYDDNDRGDMLVYSKTRLIPEAPVCQRFLCSGPLVIRGETIVYGGSRNGVLNRDVVLRKHLDVKSEGELIEKLRREGILPGRDGTAQDPIAPATGQELAPGAEHTQPEFDTQLSTAPPHPTHIAETP